MRVRRPAVFASRSARYAAYAAALASLAAFVACTLNPQPLPPRDEFGGGSDLADAGAKSDSGSFNTSPQAPSEDAATGTPAADVDGAVEGGGDGGDGGDAADDGAADASDGG